MVGRYILIIVIIIIVSSFCQAPEWAEGDVCHMCRVKFSTFQRQVSNLGGKVFFEEVKKKKI